MNNNAPYNMNEESYLSEEMIYAPAQDCNDRELSLISSNLLRVLWRRRLVVLLVVMAALGGSFVYLVKAKQVFTSTAQIYVEKEGPKIINELEGVMTQSKNYLFTQCEILRSSAILREVVGTDQAPGVEFMDFFTNVSHGIENNGARVDYLRDRLQVSVDSKTDIITISLESANSSEAATLVNAIVDAYRAYHTSANKTTAGQVVDILKQSKEKGIKERDAIYNKLLEFSQNDSVTPTGFGNKEGKNIILQKLGRLSEALTVVQLEMLTAKADYQEIQGLMSSPGGISQLVNSRKASGDYNLFANEEVTLRKEMETLQKQLVNMRQDSTMAHPQVQNIRMKIAELQIRMTELESKYARAYSNNLTQAYRVAMQKEAKLQEALTQQQKLALEVNTRAVKYARLQSELNRAEKFCDMLDERIKNINITESAGALNILDVEYAAESMVPKSPRSSRILGFGLVLGLVLGILLAILCDFMDSRLHTATEISATLGVPVLGVIPAMPNRIKADGHRETNSDRGMVVNRNPSSVVAEAYRTIRTAVYFGLPEQDARLILVTSPEAGDGKTTLVSNLAITMAQAGQKVLVIDGDLRKPDQHNVFNVKSEYGLCDVLEGKMELAQAIRPTRIEGLDILTSGMVTQAGYRKTTDQASKLREQAGKVYDGNGYGSQVGPAEMLSSKMFYDLTQTLLGQYDRILIDSPPVTYVADARILGAICEVTLMVLRANKSTRTNSQQSRDCLMSVGANVLGAVVNGVHPKKSYYGHYSGGMQYYGNYGTNSAQSSRASNNSMHISQLHHDEPFDPLEYDKTDKLNAGRSKVIKTSDIETLKEKPLRRNSELVDD